MRLSLFSVESCEMSVAKRKIVSLHSFYLVSSILAMGFQNLGVLFSPI